MTFQIDRTWRGRLRFAVPVYRLANGMAWVRVGQGTFDSKVTFGDVRESDWNHVKGLGFSFPSDFYYVDEWIDEFVGIRGGLGKGSHPVFALVEGRDLLGLWIVDPSVLDDLVDCDVLVSDPSFFNVGLFLEFLVEMGASSKALQGVMQPGFQDVVIPPSKDVPVPSPSPRLPFCLSDTSEALLDRLRVEFSDPVEIVVNHEIKQIRDKVASFFGPDLGFETMSFDNRPYLRVVSNIDGIYQNCEFLVFIHPGLPSWPHTPSRSVRFEIQDRFDSRVSVEDTLLRAVEVAMDPPPGEGEPLFLPPSRYEAWWSAKAVPVEPLFDLSMFKLLGVQNPCLLSDEDFVAWVSALEVP